MVLNINTGLKKNIVDVICLLYIVLFVYAAVSKLLEFDNFRAQIGQSPLLSPFADFISILVIAVEIIIAFFLSISKTKKIALWAAVALMSMFTTYILIILNFSSYVPCSCGGILEKLGWSEHLVFNLIFLLLGISAVKMRSDNKQVLVRIFVLISASVFVIVGLFLFSEDIMQKENPFIRRFPQAAAAKVNGLDLKNPYYYVAGINGKKIYLANRMSPLQILETDSDLKYKVNHSIELDRENFKFKAVEVRVNGPFFYVTDGTVPVIYKGLISDWKAKIIMEKKFYFSDIVILESSNKFIFRTQRPYSGENVLGLAKGNGYVQINFSSQILQKQNDGIFDTDGTLQYSKKWDKLIYTYYYRNQYIISDSNLTVKHRANTIDTTTKAKLKVVKLKQSGDIKLGAPPYIVNRHTTVYNNLLFVNSLLRGRYEGDEVWKHSTVVDIYDILNRSYVFSFYVFDEEGSRMKNFFAADSAMYIISGNYLLKYGYGKKLISKFR